MGAFNRQFPQIQLPNFNFNIQEPNPHPAGTVWGWPSGGQPQRPGFKDTAQPEPSLDFGPLQLPPEVQAYLDTMRGISFGGGAMPERTPIPSPTPVAPDPGLQLLAEGAQQRGKQQLGVLEEMRADLERDNPEGRSAWLRLGEWLGMVGERGWENAGGAMHEMLQRDREAARALRQEAAQLVLAGFGVEEAMTQAQANLLSGNHQTQVANQQAQYQTDVANAQGQNQWALSGWQAGNQNAAARASAQARIAEATMQALGQARQQREALLRPFLGMPGYEDDAIRGIYGDQLPPDAVNALTQNVIGDERGMMLYGFLARMNDAGRAASVLRQFDPTITEDQYNNDPAGTIARALRGPNADAAYRQLAPSLRLTQRFGLTEAQ